MVAYITSYLFYNFDNMQRPTILWLFLSSFGIMFAVMSWVQDSQLDGELLDESNKGFAALITGALLYHFLAKKA